MKIPCKKVTIKPERNILCLSVVQQDKRVTRRIDLTLLTKALYEFGCLKKKVWLFLKFCIWQHRYFTEFPWHDFAWPERNIPKLTVCVLASRYHCRGMPTFSDLEILFNYCFFSCFSGTLFGAHVLAYFLIWIYLLIFLSQLVAEWPECLPIHIHSSF